MYNTAELEGQSEDVARNKRVRLARADKERAEIHKVLTDEKFVSIYKSDPFANRRAANLMWRGIILPSEMLHADSVASV